MLTLPLPVVVALALVYAAARAWWGDGRGRWHPLMVALVVAVAAQSLLVALVQHYGWAGGRWLQPVTAAALPPLTWCAFLAVQVRPLRARDAAHAWAPLLALLCLRFWPVGLDPLVIASFVVYGLALLGALRPGAAELPLARLASGNVPRWLWRFVALCLLGSALGDLLICLDQLMQLGRWRGPMISVMSSLLLLSLGLVSLSPEWRLPLPRPLPGTDEGFAVPADEHPATDIIDAAVAADPVVLARLDAHMRESRPWLNPDLTLVALARKLGVSAKSLSAAVNQGHGENVARYVNRHRIEHACELLLAGRPVTTALFDSGFNTKSNFHREFLRLHHMSPTQWLAQHGPRPDPVPGDPATGVH